MSRADRGRACLLGVGLTRHAEMRRGLKRPVVVRQPFVMRLPGRGVQTGQVAASERGFLDMAGRDADLPLREVLIRFRDLVSADMEWADSRKARFRTRASCAKVAALTLAAVSTVVLGIPAIPDRTATALPMVALVTLLSALEPYFNWRRAGC